MGVTGDCFGFVVGCVVGCVVGFVVVCVVWANAGVAIINVSKKNLVNRTWSVMVSSSPVFGAHVRARNYPRAEDTRSELEVLIMLIENESGLGCQKVGKRRFVINPRRVMPP